MPDNVAVFCAALRIAIPKANASRINNADHDELRFITSSGHLYGRHKAHVRALAAVLHATQKRVVTSESPLPLAVVKRWRPTNKLPYRQTTVNDWLLGFYLIANTIATQNFSRLPELPPAHRALGGQDRQALQVLRFWGFGMFLQTAIRFSSRAEQVCGVWRGRRPACGQFRCRFHRVRNCAPPQ